MHGIGTILPSIIEISIYGFVLLANLTKDMFARWNVCFFNYIPVAKQNLHKFLKKNLIMMKSFFFIFYIVQMNELKSSVKILYTSSTLFLWFQMTYKTYTIVTLRRIKPTVSIGFSAYTHSRQPGTGDEGFLGSSITGTSIAATLVFSKSK